MLVPREVQRGLVDVFGQQRCQDEARPTALTRTPSTACSEAAAWVRPTTPCLATVSALAVAKPTGPRIEAMLMIDPPPVAFIAPMAARWVKKTPLRFTQ
jgi:hypothetical protein